MNPLSKEPSGLLLINSQKNGTLGGRDGSLTHSAGVTTWPPCNLRSSAQLPFSWLKLGRQLRSAVSSQWLEDEGLLAFELEGDGTDG